MDGSETHFVACSAYKDPEFRLRGTKMAGKTILEVDNLTKFFNTPGGQLHAVDGVSFKIEEGKTLGIVGESGCGKTVMCRSVMKLLPPNAHVKSGEISLCGENITAYKRKKWKSCAEVR